MKGKTSIGELHNMPYRFIQTLYYKSWKESLNKDRSSEDLEEMVEEMVDK